MIAKADAPIDASARAETSLSTAWIAGCSSHEYASETWHSFAWRKGWRLSVFLRPATSMESGLSESALDGSGKRSMKR